MPNPPKPGFVTVERSPIDITKTVDVLSAVENVKSIEEFNAQKASFQQALNDLKTHLTFEETQVNTLAQAANESSVAMISLQARASALEQQVSTQQATIEDLRKRLAAVTEAPPPANPANLADSFRKIVDQIQTQARVQSISGPATTIRSMDIEVKGVVNVQPDGTPVLILPAASDTTVNTNLLSTFRLSFAAIPNTGTAPPPVITGINPVSGPLAGGTNITITGSGFTGASSVLFGSAPGILVSVVSDTQLNVNSPAGSGTVDIVVITSRGGASAKNSADQFTYTPPQITQLSPNSGPTAGGTAVTIGGSGFIGTTSVVFGTNPATIISVDSDSAIRVTSPAGTGVVDVIVTASGVTSSATAADKFNYVVSPTVSKISPATGPGTGGTAIQIAGTGFSGVTAVSFGKAPAAFTVIALAAGNIINATSPPGSGVVDVLVTATGGTSASSPADQFTYTPVITKLVPDNGPVSGGTAVQIEGGGLAGTGSVTFGDVAAVIKSVSDASIGVTTPGRTAPGGVQVLVKTSTGLAQGKFTYNPAGPPPPGKPKRAVRKSGT